MKNSVDISDWDLELNLSGLPVEVFQKALSDSASAKLRFTKKPELEDSELLLVSLDLIEFLGYLDVNLLSELELQRFRKRLRGELEGCLLNSISKGRRSHYQWTLSALSFFSWGRYLDSSPDESSDETVAKRAPVLDFPKDDDES